MCGIAGFIDADHALSDIDQRLTALQAALRHRGPDDQGSWHSACGVAHLAHVRLSILDLSTAGHQPMSTVDGRYSITFNGEVYNFRELRAELEAQGHVFRSGTDTEVLLALYAKHGRDCLRKLDGMFAFAIWDAVERTCFLARDAFGIKPLYYSATRGVFAFASELRALQSAGFAGASLNPQSLCGYFETGSVPEPETLLSDVQALEAGSYLLWKNGNIQRECWWQIRFDSSAPMSKKEAVATLREALVESMRRHLVSDVPVGIFLSGGIDSTALVALARHVGVKDIATFSIGVDDPALDESSMAARTAAHFQTRHHELRLDANSAREKFEKFIKHIDQPSIDGFNTFTVSSYAKQNGLKVVLSGLGGDELFAGYPSFQKVPSLLRSARLLGLFPELTHQMGMMLEHRTDSHRMRRLGAFLQGPLTIDRAYGAFRGIFSRRSARLLAARYAGVPLAEFLHEPIRGSEAPLSLNDRDEVSRCELSRYMRHQLLKDSDVMSMTHGIELRVPLVDRKLFEVVSRIPPEIRLQPGKRLLVDAVPELPTWVVNQKKRGFLFPYRQWAQSTWGAVFQETNSHLPVRSPTWYQTWAVFMLDQWIESAGMQSQW
jgi:asparagine synthase (glutamine-hydrolysing)